MTVVIAVQDIEMMETLPIIFVYSPMISHQSVKSDVYGHLWLELFMGVKEH